MARPWKPTAPPVPKTSRQQQWKSERKGKRAYKQRNTPQQNPTRQDQTPTSTIPQGTSRNSTKSTTAKSFIEKTRIILDLPIGDGFEEWMDGVPPNSNENQRQLAEWKGFQRKWSHLNHEKFINKIFEEKREWRRKIQGQRNPNHQHYWPSRGYQNLRRFQHLPQHLQHPPQPLRQHSRHSDSRRTKQESISAHDNPTTKTDSTSQVIHKPPTTTTTTAAPSRAQAISKPKHIYSTRGHQECTIDDRINNN